MGLEAIRAVIVDVDGVLTDGSIPISDDATEARTFHVWDGAGIKFLLRSGVQVAFLSGRFCHAVVTRARELGVSVVRQDARHKLPVYEEVINELGLSDEAVAYVGDDLADIPVMRRAGVAFAVADAREEVRAVADEVTQAPGGRGAVREVAERILKAQGKWAEILSRYSR